MSERYGQWTIDYDPKPIPTRKFDYSFWHDDFDDAPDAYDNRAGTAASVEEAKAEIDMIEDMDRDLLPAEEEWVNDATQRAVLMMDNQRLTASLNDLRAHVTHLLYAIDRGYFGESASLRESAFVEPLRAYANSGLEPIREIQP